MRIADSSTSSARSVRLPAIAGALLAALALTACTDDERNLVSTGSDGPRELVATVVRAENPGNNDYVVPVRPEPAGAVQTFTTIPGQTSGLVASPNGTLWTVTTGADSARILRIDPGGAVSIFLKGFKGLRGIARDSAGRLYVSSSVNGTVERVDTDSTRTVLATGLSGAMGLALSPDESKLYAASSMDDRIVEIDLAGMSASDLALPTPLDAPAALAFDAQGVLYVGSAANTRIVTVDVTKPSLPMGVLAEVSSATSVGALLHSGGTLYAAVDWRIVSIADDGSVVRIAGNANRDRRDADPASLANFLTPVGLVASGQTVSVLDSGPVSAVRRIGPGQSEESGSWLPEYGDTGAYALDLAAWTFSRNTSPGDTTGPVRIDISTTTDDVSAGSLVVSAAGDRLSILGLVLHDVWVRIEVYRLL